MNKPAALQGFARLLQIIETLRAPGGCPWDREQTPMTLRSTVTEETFELVHAIQEGQAPEVQEELGDLFLNAAMIGEMGESEGRFTLAESLHGICDKLIRRHPHVYGTSQASTSSEVLTQWAQIKAAEKSGAPEPFLHKVGRALPPLEKAQEIQKKVAKVGFDWPQVQGIIDKIQEELAEVQEEMARGSAPEALEMEIGDLLFAVVNLARFQGLNASLCLNRSVEKFKNRFGQVELGLQAQGKSLAPEHRQAMEELWDQARAREKAQ